MRAKTARKTVRKSVSDHEERGEQDKTNRGTQRRYKRTHTHTHKLWQNIITSSTGRRIRAGLRPMSPRIGVEMWEEEGVLGMCEVPERGELAPRTGEDVPNPMGEDWSPLWGLEGTPTGDEDMANQVSGEPQTERKRSKWKCARKLTRGGDGVTSRLAGNLFWYNAGTSVPVCF